MEKQGITKSTNEYVPGICNIRAEERQSRAMGGWMWLLGTIVLWIIFVFTHTPQGWRIFIIVPASMSATGFLQYIYHFCAGFGIKGVFNFGPQIGKTDTVTQSEFRKKDRQTAFVIIFRSVLIGCIAAVAAFLIRF